MQKIKKLIFIGLTALIPSVAQATIFQCETNGVKEYRDTPCPNTASADNTTIDVAPPKKSGGNYTLTGEWCQYAKAQNKNSSRSTREPKTWTFLPNKTLIVKSAIASQGKDDKKTAGFTLAGDYLQTDNAQIGNWFVEEYNEKSKTFSLSNNSSGVRYLKKGQCLR